MRWGDSNRLMPTLTGLCKSSKATASALSNNAETLNGWKYAASKTETVLFRSYFVLVLFFLRHYIKLHNVYQQFRRKWFPIAAEISIYLGGRFLFFELIPCVCNFMISNDFKEVDSYDIKQQFISVTIFNIYGMQF